MRRMIRRHVTSRASGQTDAELRGAMPRARASGDTYDAEESERVTLSGARCRDAE